MAAQEIFACAECPKTFPERRRYTQHRKTHSRPIKCQSCPKTFASRTDSTRHINAVHRISQPRAKCTIGDCTFTSNRKDNLAQHIRTVHPSKSAQPNDDIESLEISPRANDDIDVVDVTSNSFQTLDLTAFMEAASTNNYSLLENMLKMGVNVDVQAEDGYTALHCAAKTGEAAMISFLLDKGAAIDPRNTKMQKRRPIHEAISARHVEAMSALFHAGADILLPDAKGQTVIDYIGLAENVQLAQTFFSEERKQICASEMASLLAAVCVKSGNHLILKWLLSQFHNALPDSMNRGESPIYVVTKRGHDEVVGILLSSSHVLSHSTDVFTKSIKRSLTWAVLRGSAGLVKTLLGCDTIDLNQMDKYQGDSTLNRALFRGDSKVVETLLIHHNINVNSRSGSGPTPLIIAANRGNCEVVEILLSHPKVDVNVQDHNRQTPLLLPASRGDSQIVKALLGHPKIDVNMRDTSLNTPFHIAAGKAIRLGELEVDKFLVDRLSLDTSAFLDSFHGYTALHIAAQHHRHDIFRFLLEDSRSDVNRRTLMKSSVIHYTIQYNCLTAVKLLLARPDIDLTLRNIWEMTALDLARRLGKPEMFELLLSHGAVGESLEMDPTIADRRAHEQSCWTAQDEEQLRSLNVQSNTVEMEDSDIDSDSEECGDVDMSI